MEKLKIKALPTNIVRKIQRGGLDNNQQKPEIQISNGNGNPCRHCLKLIKEGEELLILSYKPFTATHAFTESGPIFLHKRECEQSAFDNLPEILLDSEEFLLRGYDANERIVYGSGKIIPNNEIKSYSLSLLEKSEVKFIHVRSASNNCYQAKIELID